MIYESFIYDLFSLDASWYSNHRNSYTTHEITQNAQKGNIFRPFSHLRTRLSKEQRYATKFKGCCIVLPPMIFYNE
jgi:hypothetical protein